MKHRFFILTPSSRRGAVRSTFVVGLIAGVFLTGLVLAAVLIWLRLTDDPVYTDDALRDARSRWADSGPADYDMTIIVSGRQPGEIHVEVRDGQPTRVIRDHQQLTVANQMLPWTVPGMFDTVVRDADNSADAAAGDGPFAGEDGSPIMQWVRFHPQLGYPQRYHRVIRGTPQEIRWEVTVFQPK